jgi:hypothetical protein
MKGLLILFLSICALQITQVSAGAGCLSFGIPFPFPFLFYNFGPKCCPQPGYEKGYSKDYYYYRPSSTGPWCCYGDWSDPRARRAIVIPGV